MPPDISLDATTRRQGAANCVADPFNGRIHTEAGSEQGLDLGGVKVRGLRMVHAS